MAKPKSTPGLFIVRLAPSGIPDLRFAFAAHAPDGVSREDARALMRLGPSVAAVHAFLVTLSGVSNAMATVGNYPRVISCGDATTAYRTPDDLNEHGETLEK